jgi:hypothetical protein
VRSLLLRCTTLVVTAGVTAGTAAAQANDRCFFQVEFVGDTGRQVASPDGVNYFAGGGVRLSCRGTSVRMSADSVASYNGGRRVDFVGRVRYRDSTLALDADRGTYYKDGERWEARGQVRTANLRTGSTLEGPSVDYFRRVRGLRDTTEMVAVGRPTIRYVAVDSGSTAADSTGREPYVIVGDRVRLKGDDRIWAAGKVTVMRSDMDARADSMALDTRSGRQEGVLLRDRPVFRGMDRDTFDLVGDRIDFGLDNRELRVVTSVGKAEATSADRKLVAERIQLHVRERRVRRISAWGGPAPQAAATGDAYAARGDSLVFESPAEHLERLTAVGNGWVAAKADSASGERDWVAGDTVVARMRTRGDDTSLDVLDATLNARAFYRGSGDGKARGGLAYVRGATIRVTMQADKDEVARVDVHGAVDGVRLEPGAPEPAKKATAIAPGGRSAATRERTP